MITSRFLICVTLGAWLSMTACEKESETAAPASGASDSMMNRPDAKTPMDQSESGEAIAITAAIRRAIMDDGTMSLGAQNCKIITDAAGVVTLQGTVATQAEKDAIETLAKAVPGVTAVQNELEIDSN